jgi:ABC-2 type transport system permease protein
MNAVVASTRAELLRLRRWPAVWIMIGIWALLSLLFAYVFPYVSYRTGNSAGPVENALLADVLPSGVPAALISGMPMFGGAIMLILGALAVGSGYGWGTWKTVFTQGPGRGAAFGGTLAALAIFVVSVVVGTAVLDLGTSMLVATVENQPLDFASTSAMAEAIGGGLLIFGMWTMGGVLVGTLARGPALAVGLGLVWTLVLENLLRGVSNLLSWLEPLTEAFPGTAAGSLAGAVGATPLSAGDDGTPGVLTVLGGGTATWMLVAYVIVFAGLATGLVRRRDLA